MLHDTKDTTKQCPCGSGKPFSCCCEPAINGNKPATTAEALMRSRYTAFALGSVDYLIATTAAENRQPEDAPIIAEQMRMTTWTGVKIIRSHNGGREDTIGTVEFTAYFDSEGQSAALQERSHFRQENSRWYYIDGDVEIRRN